jgi:hypothetical protein
VTRNSSRGPNSSPAGYARIARSVGVCEPCGKYTYLSRKAAKAIAKRANPADPGTAYRCPRNLDQWHVGHLPPEIRNGTR